MPRRKAAQPIRRTWAFCPRCGSPATVRGAHPFHCKECEYTHFFGPCTAVGAVTVVPDGRVLLVVRGKDPGKGLYGLPGGFVDPGETAEEALRREVFEEIGVKVTGSQYLTSFPNEYVYCGAILPVTDLFFLIQIDDPSVGGLTLQDGEIDGWELRTPTKSVLQNMAFRSNQLALQHFIKLKRNGTLR
jgi:ADP-ribose pyrophosphatase YjhB (NUDIX family)